MNIFREIPPTAGFPLHAKDFLSAFTAKVRQDDCLEKDFKNYLDVPSAHITCSGTAALYIIAKTLKEISLKRTIIIPSFICPLVPLAVKRAGFDVEVCDIEKDSFNFNSDELEAICSGRDDIAAVIINHLAGIPFDFDSIKDVVKKHGLFVIEDCAQALGALYKGRKVGTLGDFSFFSLAAGKGLTLYEGGAVLTNRMEYATAIEDKTKQLLQGNIINESMRVLQLIGYGAFYRPELFWFVFRLPEMFWDLQGKKLRAAREYFTIDFPLHSVSRFRKSVGHVTFSSLNDQIDRQRAKASDIIEGLKGLKGIRVLTEAPHDRATYPYVAVLFDEQAKQKRALEMFKNSGLGISRIYALAVSDYDYLSDFVPDRNCSNARSVADRAITLSTSFFLDQNEIDKIVQTMSHLSSSLF